MHLLAATPGSIDDGSEPVDPGQTPADVVFISAADTELAALSEARADLGEAVGSLRLTNLTHLQHPMSADLHLDNRLLAVWVRDDGVWRLLAIQSGAIPPQIR